MSEAISGPSNGAGQVNPAAKSDRDMDDGLSGGWGEDEGEGEEDELVGAESGATDFSQDEWDESYRTSMVATNFADQRVVFPEGYSKAQAIAHLMQRTTTNEYGLPLGFYRSDYIPSLETLTQGEVDNAFVTLDYSEGYPVYDRGKLFWQQMPHEGFTEFTYFQRFLDQVEDLGLRQLQILSMDENVSLGRIADLHDEYCWALRARAYDLFQQVATRRKREARARKLETMHQDLLSDRISELLGRFEDPDWIKELSAKDAASILIDMMKMQRATLGLAVNGNAGNQALDPLAGADNATLMKEVTKGVTAQSEGLGVGGSLMILLQDPNFAMQAQALVLKVRQQDEVQTLTAVPEQ